NTSYLLKYSGDNPDPTQPADKLRVNNNTVVLSYRPDGTALILGNPYNNKGDGVWVWKGDLLQQVLQINKTQVNGSLVQAVESGVYDGAGQVTLMLSTLVNPMVVVRTTVGGPIQTLFQYGDTLPVQVPNILTGFVTFGRSGNPMFFAGGTSNVSIVEFRDG